MLLKPITLENIGDFEDTSYDALSPEDKKRLINESLNKSHNGSYFEFLVVYEGDTAVGFMNLYAHSEHIISCAPEIKKSFRNSGLGYSAECEALKFAKRMGYTIAVAGVDENNFASIALHKKLGFELDRRYTNKQGRNILLYITAL